MFFCCTAEDAAGGESRRAAAQQERAHAPDRTDGVGGATRTEETQDRGHSARGHARSGRYLNGFSHEVKMVRARQALKPVPLLGFMKLVFKSIFLSFFYRVLLECLQRHLVAFRSDGICIDS